MLVSSPSILIIGLFDIYSILLINARTFNNGSRRDPNDGSLSSTVVRVSRSRYMAAIVAAKSPYLPDPNEYDP